MCKIGRAPDNHFVLSTDKSVSRYHAEIRINTNSNSNSNSSRNTKSSNNYDNTITSLQLVDLGSRFGTIINNQKLEPNSSQYIDSNTVIVIGAGNSASKIRIVFYKLKICTTRLTKVEKEKLKCYLQLMNGILIQNIDTANYLVTNTTAATIKMLAAIVFKINIITIDWFQFLDVDSPVVEIPIEDK